MIKPSESLFRHFLVFEKALFGYDRSFDLPAGSALLLLSAEMARGQISVCLARHKALQTVPVLSDFCFRMDIKTHLSGKSRLQ